MLGLTHYDFLAKLDDSTKFPPDARVCRRYPEHYGYVNRPLPDSELDSFVNRFATRIALPVMAILLTDCIGSFGSCRAFVVRVRGYER